MIHLLLCTHGEANSQKILFIAIYLGKIFTKLRLNFLKPRSFWGVTPILTLPLKSSCDKLLGIQSESLVFTTYSITGKFDYNLSWIISDPRLSKYYRTVPTQILRLILSWALLRYDFFNYFHDRGIYFPEGGEIGFNEEELVILKKAGKQLNFYSYGADVRTREKTLQLGKWNFCIRCPKPKSNCICDEIAGVNNTQKIAKYANAVVSLGDMLNYTPNSNHLHYWPINVVPDHGVTTIKENKNGRVLTVLHATNHSFFKGTWLLEEAIENLRSQNVKIDLIKVSGVSNIELLEIMKDVDVVADQFIGGMYGYTALEAMSLGKPVLCYVRSEDLLLKPALCPIIRTTPETLAESLLWCYNNPGALIELGNQGKVYIRKFHSVEAVACRLGDLYIKNNSLPERLKNKIHYRVNRLKELLEA